MTIRYLIHALVKSHTHTHMHTHPHTHHVYLQIDTTHTQSLAYFDDVTSTCMYVCLSCASLLSRFSCSQVGVQHYYRCCVDCLFNTSATQGTEQAQQDNCLGAACIVVWRMTVVVAMVTAYVAVLWWSLGEEIC